MLVLTLVIISVSERKVSETSMLKNQLKPVAVEKHTLRALHNNQQQQC